jgi:hypothetical protein
MPGESFSGENSVAMEHQSPEAAAYETYTQVVIQNDGATSEQLAARLRAEAGQRRAEADIESESLVVRTDVIQNFSPGLVMQVDTDSAGWLATLLEKSADGIERAFHGAPAMMVHMDDAAGRAQLGGSQIMADPGSFSVKATGERISDQYGFVSVVMAEGLDAHENEHLVQSGAVDSFLQWQIDAYSGNTEDALELGAAYTQAEVQPGSIRYLSTSYRRRINAVTITAQDRDDIRGGTEGIVRFVERHNGTVKRRGDSEPNKKVA